jgi:hypothetical protein
MGNPLIVLLAVVGWGPNYKMRLILKMKLGMISLQSISKGASEAIEAGDFNGNQRKSPPSA